jgi:hypothetical protein
LVCFILFAFFYRRWNSAADGLYDDIFVLLIVCCNRALNLSTPDARDKKHSKDFSPLTKSQKILIQATPLQSFALNRGEFQQNPDCRPQPPKADKQDSNSNFETVGRFYHCAAKPTVPTRQIAVETTKPRHASSKRGIPIQTMNQH